MNAAEQLALAEALRAALAGEAHRPILIEDPIRAGGNVVSWAQVPAINVLGVLMRHGWKISLADAPKDKAPLHLVKPGGHRDGHEL